LANHLPQLTITSPRDGSLLPQGSWKLGLSVEDWPLADAGALGLGAHIAVQIDSEAPLRFTASTAGKPTPPTPPTQQTQHKGTAPKQLLLELPPLAAGSHRVTVYAAYPWGEAVKVPGAIRQVRVHRLAANPQTLPKPGTPQLIPVSPVSPSQSEPLLFDWLLLDAPLQNLRDGDGSWRLKATINNDTFLVDQNVPLWLKGWKNGSNSLKLELVDGFGDPLNPPFNSFVQEVQLTPHQGVPVPAWAQGRLNPDERDLLLGLIKAETPTADTGDSAAQSSEVDSIPGEDPGEEQQEAPITESESVVQPVIEEQAGERVQPLNTAEQEEDQHSEAEWEPEPDQAQDSSPERSVEPAPVAPTEPEPEPEPEAVTEAKPQSEAEQAPAFTPEPSENTAAAVATEPDVATDIEAGSETEQESEPNLASVPQPDQSNERELETEPGAATSAEVEASTSPAEPLTETLNASTDDPAVPEESGNPTDGEQPEAFDRNDPMLRQGPPPAERIMTSSPLEGTARDLVNPDGSLIKTSPGGPLARLRQLIPGP
jgi:hypothetical protein